MKKEYPQQTFNDKTFKLYDGEKYFSRGNIRLHVYVWEMTNGKKVPAGFHVHHIDGNTYNNAPGNLELKEAVKHNTEHATAQHEENADWSKTFQAKGVEAAKEWHSTEDGKKWHAEHSQKVWEDRPYVAKICQQCGTEYKTRTISVTKFCSPKCKAKNFRERRK